MSFRVQCSIKMTNKCDKCGRFTSDENKFCATCLKTNDPKLIVFDMNESVASTKVFRFEIPTFKPEQQGGIRT